MVADPLISTVEDQGWSPARKVGWLTALLAGEILVVLVFQSPHQTFVRFAAMDSGGELAIQAMIRRGLAPGIDFGYPYGLLALLMGRIWYGLAGLSPMAYQVYVGLIALVAAWGLARVAVARGVGCVGIGLIVLAIPDLIFVTYLTSVQTLEQALLIHALAEQSRGRRGRSLACLTACCFVKPSLAFVQGLTVLILTLIAGRRAGRAAMVRSILPPLVVGVGLAVGLSLWFGPVSLARTLSPATGAAIYRANHYGFFFGQGRAFWILPGAGVRDYFRYEVGFWLLATTLLAWGTVTGLKRLAGPIISRPEIVTDDELIVTCGAVHLAFVALLFGHRWTWVYSLPMLILGLAILSRRGRVYRWLVVALGLCLLVSDRSKTVAMLQQWRTEAHGAGTLGLWTTPREGAEWERVLELTRGSRPVLFAMCEGGSILFPTFQPPVAGYLVPGNMVPVEVDRKARQLAEAEFIVAYAPPTPDGFQPWDRLHAAFDGCDRVFAGEHFTVHRRRIRPGNEKPRRKAGLG